MKAIHFILLALLLWGRGGECSAGTVDTAPLLGGMVFAQESRVRLADLLYRRGVEAENAGDLQGAVRIWHSAYQLDRRNEVIKRRFIGARECIERVAVQRYNEALFDIRHGRSERSTRILRMAHEPLPLPFGGWVDGGGIHSVDLSDLGGNEVWTRLDKLSGVEGLISKGEYQDARIMLDAILDEYPDWMEAKELYEVLSSMKVGHVGKSGETSGRMGSSASGLWLDYRRLKEEGRLGEARERLMTLEGLYGGGGTAPAFAADLGRERSELERQIEGSLRDQLSDIREGLPKALWIMDSERRLVGLVGLYGRLRPVLSRYKGLEEVVELEEEVLGELVRVARVDLAKAGTLRTLDGCGVAVPAYKRLLGILTYPELAIYRRAEEGLKGCEE